MNQATVRNNPDPRQQVLSAVQAADSVLLFCHVSPDGDTLGSALALKLRLTAMGKSVRLLVDGEVPSNLAFLSRMGAVEGPEAAAGAADLALAVDVSCKERLGACAPAFLAAARTAVVDHHSSNPGFAQINWVDGDAPATAVLVYRLLEAMGGALSREEAVCLYTGLSTDTGNFIYESTSAESFRMMAALMEAGLPLAEYARRLFRVKELPFVRLLGKTLPSLHLICGGKVAGITLTAAQMRQAGAKAGHTDGLVDYAIDLEGVAMAYFARETEDGRVKVSLRALEPWRVDQVAERFGGGGHRLASGLTLDMPLAEVVRAVEGALTEALGGVNA